MSTTQHNVTVNLGPQRHVVDERLASGNYATADEVIQAALQALEREETEHDAWLVALAEKSLADPRPSIPAEDVFRSLRAKYGRPEAEQSL